MTDYPTPETATDEQLAAAAAAYLDVGARLIEIDGSPVIPGNWPFAPEAWMPNKLATVNYSRALGYVSYLVNKTTPPDVSGAVAVSIGKKES